MMEMKFEVGKVYKCGGVCKGDPMRFVVCVGRQGDDVCFAFCDSVAIARDVNGWGLDREFGKVKDRNGCEYNVSAAITAEKMTAWEVMEMAGGQHG